MRDYDRRRAIPASRHVGVPRAERFAIKTASVAEPAPDRILAANRFVAAEAAMSGRVDATPSACPIGARISASS